MKILGFETTDMIASVALYDEGQIYTKTLNGELRHAESVLPAAESLLAEHQLETSDMDAFAVDIGPGSFTGVRIGVCLANALAFAHKKKVIPVNSLETLACPFFSCDKNVASIIDARNGNGYAALYRNGKPVIEAQACEIEEFLRTVPSDTIMTGTACNDNAIPSAEHVVVIASLRDGRECVSPLYLKLSQAERMQKND